MSASHTNNYFKFIRIIAVLFIMYIIFDGSTLIDYCHYLNMLTLPHKQSESMYANKAVNNNTTNPSQILDGKTINYPPSKSLIVPPSISNVDASKVTKFSECTQSMNDSLLHFTDTDERKQKFRFKSPTWLMSYGGSGNTLTRVIIEYITSIWSGSTKGDDGLARLGFKGQRKCKRDDGVLIVKSHPEQHNMENMDLECWDRFGSNYAKQYAVLIDNISAIFIIRNPFRAIFAMYNYKYGRGQDRHIHTVPMTDWNVLKFIQVAIAEAGALTQTRIYMEHIRSEIDNGMDNYKYIVIRFEDFFNTQTVFGQMDKILRFVYNDEYYNRNVMELHHRIRCVTDHFLPDEYGRFGSIHRKYTGNIVTFDFAFKEFYKMDPKEFCRFWSTIKWVAINYDYDNLPFAQCK